jgi:hypothetical protein
LNNFLDGDEMKANGENFKNCEKLDKMVFGCQPKQRTPKRLKECNTIVISFVSKPEDIYS